MKTKNVLIVCDSENQCYWNTWIDNIKERLKSVRIDIDISGRENNNVFDMIMVDKSNLEELRHLIPKIRHKHSQSRILVVSSTPTWKQTREVIRLGAANLIRKSSNLEEIIKEFELL